MTTKHTTAPGYIGACDDYRRGRLLKLHGLLNSSKRSVVSLDFPSWHDIEPARRDLTATGALSLNGPETLLTLERQLSAHSQLIKAGAPVVSSSEFQKIDLPIVDRSLEADWGANSADVGAGGITAALPSPVRVSAYVTVSSRLKVQNPLLAGAFLESQLLSAIGRALDSAAIAGDGTGENPIGILNDADVLTHTLAVADTFTLAEMAAMQQSIADNDGEADDEDYLWIADTATRKTLQNTEGIGSPIWVGNKAAGHNAIGSVHAPANTLVLAQKGSLCFTDFNQLKVESLEDSTQAKQGFMTLVASGYFCFNVLSPTSIVKAINAA